MNNPNNVLNPALYNALESRFGQVRVTNRGQKRIVRYRPDPRRLGKLVPRAVERGEQYAVACPFCGDTRHRLYVSYQYGEQDPGAGDRNYMLIYCHNEKCHRDPTSIRRFRSMIALSPGRRARQVEPIGCQAAKAPPKTDLEMTLPEGLVPIIELPQGHPAILYLRSRGFDPGVLWQQWQVSVCEWSYARPSPARRIIIPVFRPVATYAEPATDEAGQYVLAGWQARTVPGWELLGGPDAKYLSAPGMQKSRLLYGLPQALVTSGPVVLCEGATDCWQFGPGAVAIFGKDLSHHQKLLLVHYFSGRPIVVLLDPDAEEQARQIRRELSQVRSVDPGDNRVVIASLPAGREDPADCSREETLTAAAAALGQDVEQLGMQSACRSAAQPQGGRP